MGQKFLQAGQKSLSNIGTGAGSNLGIAASTAINSIRADNNAMIENGANVIAGGSVTVSAKGQSDALAKSIGTAIQLVTADSNNIGAAVALNKSRLNNIATIGANSQVRGNGITIEAITPAGQMNEYVVWAAAAGGGRGDVGVAGSAAINIIDVATEANSGAGSALVSTGSVTVNAKDALTIQTLAAGGGVSSSVAVGASIAVANLDTPTKAFIVGNVSASQAINVTASTVIDPPLVFNFLGVPIEGSAIAIAGGASTGDVGIAGAVIVNDFNLLTYAFIADGASINQDPSITAASNQSITITSIDDTELLNFAGAIGVSAGSVGIGAGLDLGLMHKDTQAFIGNNANAKARGAVSITATSIEKFRTLATNAGIGNSVGVAASASVYIVDTDTQGHVGNGSQLRGDDSVTISATGNYTLTSLGLAFAIGGTAGAGAGNVTMTHDDVVMATVGDAAYLTANGGAGLTVSATSSEDIVGVSAAGAAGGSVGVAGSATVLVLHETTQAKIGHQSDVVADNAINTGTPNINLVASDSTRIVSVAGSLAVGGVAVGVGADVASISKLTEAYVDSNVRAFADGDIVITADSVEDITSVAAGVAAASGVAVAADAGVHILDVQTHAFIGNEITTELPGNIVAQSDIVIAADDRTEIDKVIGVLAVGATAGIGAAAGVSTITKDTQAYVGTGANVAAKGNGAGRAVRTGKFDLGVIVANQNEETPGIQAQGGVGLNSNASQLAATGEVGKPQNVKSTDTDQDHSNDARDPSLDGQRTSIPSTQSDYHGLAVTATNRDDIEVYTISFAGGFVGVAVSAGIGVVNATTTAYLGSNSKINADQTGVANRQSVLVVAGDDISQVSFGTSLAGGAVGVAPAVGLAVINNETHASIGAGAIVNAESDVSVLAFGTEDILVVGIGAAGGLVGFGGVVSVLSIDNAVSASIDSGARVIAMSDVFVSATDDSDIDVISGAAAGGVVGIGASVGVVTVTKRTNALIEPSAQVDALAKNVGISGVLNGNKSPDGKSFLSETIKGVIVQANSSEDFTHLAIAAGVGFVGVSGGVAVTLFDSDTTASIRPNALINQSALNAGANADQNVYVNASNVVTGFTFAGALAAGVVGMAGAVDVGSLKNDTLSEIAGGTEVTAKNDVEVNSLGIKELKGFTFSGGAGVVGVGFSASTWSVGSAIQTSYTDKDGHTGDATKGGSSQTAGSDAASQSSSARNKATSGLSNFSSDARDPHNRVQQLTHSAASDVNAKAPSEQSINNAIVAAGVSESGTTAQINAGATIKAGRNINVLANESIKMTTIIGGFGGGLIGIGGAVYVGSIASNASAHVAGTLVASGDINISALHDENVIANSFAFGGGFVGVGASVVVVNDKSVAQAYVANNAVIVAGNDVIVTTTDLRQIAGISSGIATGLAATGASFVRVSIDNDLAVETSAYIGNSASVSSRNASLSAHGDFNVSSNAIALAGGVVGTAVNFALVDIAPDTVATIGSNSQVTATEDIEVDAELLINAHATATGIAIGIGALGASIADINIGKGDGQNEVVAGIRDHATIVAGALRINAKGPTPSGTDHKIVAESIAGAGGLVGLVGASSAVDSDLSTLAILGSNSRIVVGSLNINSENLHRFDAKTSSVTIGLIAGGLGIVDNTLTGQARVAFDPGVEIEANAITVLAYNKLIKDTFDENLQSFTLGLGAGAAYSTASTEIGTAQVPFLANVAVAPGAKLTAVGSETDISIRALTDFSAYEKSVSNSYTGAIGATRTASKVIAHSLANIDVQGATIQHTKGGDIELLTRSNSTSGASTDVDLISGLGAGGSSIADATTNATTNVTLLNSLLKANTILLQSGNDQQGANLHSATAHGGMLVVSLFGLASPTANSIVRESNTINVTGSTQLLAIKNVFLNAVEGVRGASGVAKNGQVQVLAIPPRFEDVSGVKEYTPVIQVNVAPTALVEAGIHANLLVRIDPIDSPPAAIAFDRARLNQRLTASEKSALNIPVSMDYEYVPLSSESIQLSLSPRTVIHVVGNAHGGKLTQDYYQFRGSRQAVSPQLEDYRNGARWTPLNSLPEGALSYDSNIAQLLEQAINNRFYVTKPVSVDKVKLVYKNVANELFEDWVSILEQIKSQQGNTEAIARLEVQLDAITESLAQLGLTDPTSGSLVGVKTGLDALFVEVPDLLSSPGGVFIDAKGLNTGNIASLVNAGRILAHGDAKIDVLNRSPFIMDVGSVLMQSNKVTGIYNGQFTIFEPGNVYANGTSMTSAIANSSPTVRIVQDAYNPVSSYNLGGFQTNLQYLDQDLNIRGSIINENGTVYLENKEASIRVTGEVRGNEVSILSAKDFFLNSDTWFHTNQDPRQYINYDALTLQLLNHAESLRQQNLPVPTEQIIASTAESLNVGGATLAQAIQRTDNRILAQGRIVITARYLNINGLIQSGVDSVEVQIAQDFQPPRCGFTRYVCSAELYTPSADHPQQVGNLGMLPGVSFGAEGVPVNGRWDANLQAFVIEKIKPAGGEIIVAGQILSTGNGRLKVANGFASVSINNLSPFPVYIDGIDTTTQRVGHIQLTNTDTLKRADYRLDGTTIREQRLFGVLQSGNVNEVERIIYYPESAPIAHPLTDNILYAPTSGLQYVWVEGQRLLTQTVNQYESNSFNILDIIDIDALIRDENRIGTPVTTLIDREKLLQSESREVPNIYNADADHIPNYAVGNAYTLEYVRAFNRLVELIPNTTKVKHPSQGTDAHVYLYKATSPVNQSKLLSSILYSEDPEWQLTDDDPATFVLDASAHRYLSNYENSSRYVSAPQSYRSGFLGTTKTVSTTETIVSGYKDFYTHTLKADYPISVIFAQGGANSGVRVHSGGGLKLRGNISVPPASVIDLFSGISSVTAETGVVILGASPKVDAFSTVSLVVEGNKGPIDVVANGDIDLNVVPDVNGNSELMVGQIVSGSGNVFVNAAKGIRTQTSNARIAGGRVELVADQGSIGSAILPLKLDSARLGSGGLAAVAKNDIFVTEIAGALKLIEPKAINDFFRESNGLEGVDSPASVYSINGDVTLSTSDGAILDGITEQLVSAPMGVLSATTQQSLDRAVAAGQVSLAALQYPMSPELVKVLFPHVPLIQGVTTGVVEKTNVLGKHVQLMAGGSNGIGLLSDRVAIRNLSNFNALPTSQQQLLANAKVSDVLGTNYVTYRFLAANQTNIPLDQEDFSNPSRWQQLTVDHATGVNNQVAVVRNLVNGQLVLVEFDSESYGLYRYSGVSQTINLATEDYSGSINNRWSRVVAQHKTTDGSVNLVTGALVANLRQLDSLVVRQSEDVNVNANESLSARALGRINIGSAIELPLNRIESASDVRLAASDNVLDKYLNPEAAIASSGLVQIETSTSIRGVQNGNSGPFRTQIASSGSLVAYAQEGIYIQQVDDDTNIVGQSTQINDLLVRRADSDQSISITVEQGDMSLGRITSRSSIALQAQRSILDGFSDSTGRFVNVLSTQSSTGLLPAIQLIAGASIGTVSNRVDVALPNGGSLDTQSQSNTWIRSDGSLWLWSMTSISGDVEVLVMGRAEIGKISALQGGAFVVATEAIVDRDGDAEADIEAITISLATSSFIGELTDDLEIDTAHATGSWLRAVAAGDIFITETSGRLNIVQAQASGRGDVRLTTTDLATSGDTIYTPAGSIVSAFDGVVVLQSGDELRLAGTISAKDVAVRGDYRSRDTLGSVVEVLGTIISPSVDIETFDNNDVVVFAAMISVGIVVRTGKGEDEITGSQYGDRLYGGPGKDILRGGDGDDLLDAGSGIGDQLYGGKGNDRIYGSDDGSESDPNFADAIYFGDFIDAGEGDDQVWSYGGADLVLGGLGDDIIYAGRDSDRVMAGDGQDTVYAGPGLNDFVDGQSGNDLIYGADEGNDTLLGGPGDDQLYGLRGNDTLDGQDGDDYLDGGRGTDTIRGGSGDDELLGGGGAGDQLFGEDGIDLLRGSDDGADVIDGGAGDDRAIGAAGNDFISGGTGDDILEGGDGDDTIYGDAGRDTITGGAQHDVLYADSPTPVGGDTSTDYVYGDFGTNGNEPGSGSDQIFGDLSSDLLFGEGGDDRITLANSASFADYGSGESAIPFDFIVPTPTPDPSVHVGSATEFDFQNESLPTGAVDLGRWGELSESASGTGLAGESMSSRRYAITSTANGPVVVWSDGRMGNREIYVAQYALTGNPTGSWTELAGSASRGGISQTLGNSMNPKVAIVGGKVTVVWTESTISGGGVIGSHIRVAQFDPLSGPSGSWVALGTSLGSEGISGSGIADAAQIIETSFGPMVTWLQEVAGVHQVYAKVFNGTAWVAIGSSSDIGAGVSGAAAGSKIQDLQVAAKTGQVSIAYTLVDTAGIRQLYVKQYAGTSWQELPGDAAGSATERGVTAVAAPSFQAPITNSASPTLSYFNDDLFVAWQANIDQSSVALLVKYTNGTTNPTLVTNQVLLGHDSSPVVVSGGNVLRLFWQSGTDRVRGMVWNGTSMVEEIPGDATGTGLFSAGENPAIAAIAIDAQGRATAVWENTTGGRPTLNLRWQGAQLTGRVLIASATGSSLQQILDNNSFAPGDVIQIQGTITGNVTIAAGKQDVTIIGAAGAQLIGSIVVDANRVNIQRLEVVGNVRVNSVDQFSLRESRVQGSIDVRGSTNSQFSYNTVTGGGLRLTGNATAIILRRNSMAAGNVAGAFAVSLGDATGAIVGGASNVQLLDNTLSGFVGVGFYTASSGLVRGNSVTVTASGTGLDIAQPFSGPVVRNTISGGSIGVRYAAAAEVSDNDITGNTTGVVALVDSLANGFGYVAASQPIASSTIRPGYN